MSGEITFYTNPMSRGRIVRWMLEELGVPYRTEILDFTTTMKSPAYLAINPMGKVPAIRVGDQVVTETPAICVYLAETFPEAGLAPTAAERAAYYRWMFFGAGPVEAAVTHRAFGVELPSEKRGALGYGTYDAMIETLSKAVSSSPFIAGDRFTAADVYVGSQVGWGLRFGTLEKRPEFDAYWVRVSDRAAYRRAVEIDDELLAR